MFKFNPNLHWSRLLLIIVETSIADKVHVFFKEGSEEYERNIDQYSMQNPGESMQMHVNLVYMIIDWVLCQILKLVELKNFPTCIFHTLTYNV